MKKLVVIIVAIVVVLLFMIKKTSNIPEEQTTETTETDIIVADEEIEEDTQSVKGDLSSYEIPFYSDAEDEDIVQYTYYTLSYNHKTLCPNWVAYELTKEEVNGTCPRDDDFRQDFNVKGKQADLSDYKGSGWDRGHMAPAADMKISKKAMSECFYLTNMCPQEHSFNAGAWETTEDMARRIAKQYGSVYIVCGPIFDKHEFGTIGENKVQIPDAFFKAFLVEVKEGEYSAVGFIMQNKTGHQDLKASERTVDEVEKVINRDLFPNLPDEIEKKVEAKINKHTWGI